MMKGFRVLFSRTAAQKNTGYTLLEMLVVVLIIGTLLAIVVPGWLAFRNRIALSAAQTKVLSALKQAQNEAKLLNSKRQVSFRMQGKVVQWAVHDPAVSPTSTSIKWYDLSPAVNIDPYNTTLNAPVPNVVWRMQFDFDGTASGQTGRLTLVSPERPDQTQVAARSNNRPRRCVFISELIGTLREGKDKGCVVQ